MDSLIKKGRRKFHERLLADKILTLNAKGVPSNADSASMLSVKIASQIAEALTVGKSEKIVGQTAGAAFETAIMTFLSETFPHLTQLRPGKWEISKLGNRSSTKTSSFYQYSHLDYLSSLVKSDAVAASCLGNSYVVAPDIVICRYPEPDEYINKSEVVVDDQTSTKAAIRERFNKLPILHASISAKWTMRSDRAQNTRTEALGLIRNRKGNLPHIVAVTAEPMPSLISGQRLKDISDLPLDLAV